MMAPFTPHIAEELWERSGGEYSVHQQAWPVYAGGAPISQIAAGGHPPRVDAQHLLVIGGIYFGIFSPTAGAGIGAFGAFIFALARRKLGFFFQRAKDRRDARN